MAVAIQHPLLRPGAVQFRGYQANLARIAAQHDTLVVLPTGMGKTIVALLWIADAWQAGARHVLVMAPTRPLVEQHAAFLQDVLAPGWGGAVHALTGNVAPEKRQAAYTEAGIVVATPQVVHNDLLTDRLRPLPDAVVYDECHRAVGEYPYTFIGDTLRGRNPQHRRLGLTASPGHDVQKIDEVRVHLGFGHVEIRTPSDPDVAEYVQDIDVQWETLPLPPTMDRAKRLLEEALTERVAALRKIGLLKGVGRPTRRVLLDVAQQAQRAIKTQNPPDASWFQALSLQAQAMKIQHALEQVQTQGSGAFVQYMEGLREEAGSAKSSKASRSVVDDPRVNQAYHVARHDDSENPKMGRVEALVQEQLEREPDSRIIVFTHYRATCELVEQRVGALPGVRSAVFVGQGRRKAKGGLSQKQQAEILQRFRDGEHNVLVATSVAEEGLDIPATDLVVFYEPIPSEIRSIQRRGRTGRNRQGRVVVLITKGTQDEAAHWSARRKEQAMVRELQGLRARLATGGQAMEGSGDVRPRSGQPPRPATHTDQRTLALADGADAGAAAATSTSHAWPAGRAAGTPAGEEAPTPSTSSRADRGGGAPHTSTPGDARAVGHRGPRATATPSVAPAPNAPLIVCDAREQPGGVVRHLSVLGCRIETRNLDIADFVLSDRVAVERKTGADFVESLIDGRLFEQMKSLKDYPRPFLVLEGDGLLGHRNISPEALMGALASVTVDYGIPVLQTRDALETARFLTAVAKREQGRAGRHVAVRPGRGAPDDDGVALAVLAGLPGVSEVRADALLRAFGTLEAVFAASEDELAAVENIGPKTAATVRTFLTRQYSP